jgi:phage shock protein A
MTSNEPEPVPPAESATDLAPVPAPGLTPDYTHDGVPTFDYVRDKIEGRIATADGQGVLDADTPEGRTLAQQEADREAAAKDRLEEIRRSMGG